MKRIITYIVVTNLFIGCNHDIEKEYYESSDTKLKRDTVHFQSTNYSGIYSEVKEQPLFIKYKVLKCDSKGVPRKGFSFYKNDSIHTSDNADYYKNVWDKGHIVPAASQNCTKKSIKETFSFLNCALQDFRLNRGIWKQLEHYERVLARENKVEVEVKLEFNSTQCLKTGALVPSSFHKTLYLNGERYAVFFFPNYPPFKSSYESYKVE